MSKDTLLQKAEVYKALGHPIRLAIVEYLADGERCVSEIVEHVQSEQSGVSHHLAILRRARVVETERRAVRVYCTLAIPSLIEMADALGEELAA